jgi:hypothetical protein
MDRVKPYVGVALALLLAHPAWGAGREVIHTDWPDFAKQIADRHLAGRSARVRLAEGREVKARDLEAGAAGLSVAATRATRRWKTAGGRAEIPRDQVVSVRFDGRMGHGGLIGGLAGMGAGAGIGAAIASSAEVYEGAAVILVPVAAVALAGIGAVSGYFVGRAVSRRAPEFVFTK